MKVRPFRLSFCVAALMVARSPAITTGPFGPHGEGGIKNGQTILLGAGGTGYELDGFLSIAGQDLNGTRQGVCAQLSRDGAPPGIGFGFAAETSTNAGDLVLTYAFTNNTSASLPELKFFVLLDAEIDETINTFFNEYGVAQGMIGEGGTDPNPDQWQIDEPGFKGGSLYHNLLFGALSNSNSIPQGNPNDVAMALGFTLGTLAPGQFNIVRVMISETGHVLGTFSLAHFDQASPSTIITLSGQSQAQPVIFGDVTGQLQFGLQWQSNTPSVYCSYTQGGFGAENPAAHPASLLRNYFGTVYTNGQMEVGIPGNTGFSIKFTSSDAIRIFLPNGTIPSCLTSDLIDPVVTPAGVFAAQVTALQLNVDFGDRGPAVGFGGPMGNLLLDDPASPLHGRSVRQILGAANTALGGGPLPGLTIGDLSRLVDNLNKSFDNCRTNAWALTYLKAAAPEPLVGTLTLSNASTNSAVFGPPFYLAMAPSTNYWFGSPSGTLPNGWPYLDLTAGITNTPAGVNGNLEPGEQTVVGAICVHSRLGLPPPESLFQIWAQRQN
jgi:hypothetical protein